MCTGSLKIKESSRSVMLICNLFPYPRFDEVVVCVKWATPTSGGFVAVGGSKGSLVILSVD